MSSGLAAFYEALGSQIWAEFLYSGNPQNELGSLLQSLLARSGAEKGH